MKSFAGKLLHDLFTDPITSREELLIVLEQAANNKIIDKDSIPFFEALFQFGDMRAKDILLPRHAIDFIDVNKPVAEIIDLIVSTGHSRFPVIDDNINNILGVFHSKDIAQYFINPEEFNVRNLLRMPLFVPEMKPLDVLLYEMRLKHSHLAIIIDEFTNVAGLVTLEMILEQIVGEIDDEYDSVDDEHAIVELQPYTYRVKGHCGLEQFNNLTKLKWHDELVESVGGYVIKYLARIPVSSEMINLSQCTIEIANADRRKINTLLVTVIK